MTTVIVDEKRGGGASVKKGDDFTFRFTETWNFLVLASDTGVSREEVLLDTPGLPLVGVTYTATGARCTSISAERREDHTLYWDVRVEFETSPEQQDQDPGNPSPDPTTWIPRFRISFESYEEVMETDFEDTPILNSALQKFETPITQTFLISCIPFVQFEASSTTLKQIMDRNNKMNETAFLGFGISELLLNVTGAEKGWFGRYQAWRVSYTMKYDPRNWDLAVNDMGSEFIGIFSQLYPYLDAQGHRIWGPLDGTGSKVPDGDPPALLVFQIYDSIEFSSFIRQ